LTEREDVITPLLRGPATSFCIRPRIC